MGTFSSKNVVSTRFRTIFTCFFGLLYRLKSRDAHPDVGGDEEKFVRLSEAYETLRDSRIQYDRVYLVEAEKRRDLVPYYDLSFRSFVCDSNL